MNLSINAVGKFPMFLCGLLIACFSLFGADSPRLTQTWIVTNTVGTYKAAPGYLDELDLTPLVSTNVPNSSAYHNNDAKIFLRLREQIIMRATASATYGGKIMADYDVRTVNSTNASKMTDKEKWVTGHPLIKTSYFRGRVFYVGSNSFSDEWITAFASADRKRIVIVDDSGPVYISENTGAAWKAIKHSGDYEFTLSTSPNGSSVVAVVSRTNELSTLATDAVYTMAYRNWCSVASAADGSQLVLSGGPDQSAPALSITRSGSNVIVGWPASFSGFILQQSSDIQATSWASVTNEIEVVGQRNQVSMPALEGRNFFRLSTP